VQQTTIERRTTMPAPDYVGHLSTVSAYLALPPATRDRAFEQILAVLPDRVAVRSDLTVHLARRRAEHPDQHPGQHPGQQRRPLGDVGGSA
jgi:hypothetical protein